MTRGKIVLVPFPFDDLSGSKVRPAVCLTNPLGQHRHVVIAFITSVEPAEHLATDLTVVESDPSFAMTGLRKTSVLRLHRLLTITTLLIQRELGRMPASLQAEIDRRFVVLFDLRR